MKILILRFSSIGDIVLTTPVVRMIKRQVPDVQLHYATKKQYAFLLKNNPHIDQVHELNDSDSELIGSLKAEQFDHVIDLHHNIRTRRICSALKAKCHRYFKSNIEKWLMVNLKKDRLPKNSIVDRYLGAAEFLGLEKDGEGLDYFIPEKDEVDVQRLFPEIGNSFYAFAIGGQHATKKMPDQKIIELLDRIEKPVILLGGKEDEHSAHQIIEKSTNVFDASGKLNLNQSASIAKQAEAVITHDTGMMHIAAAFNKKIISLWGNTIPEFGMYPYMPETPQNSFIHEVKGLSCRPCSKIGHSKCPKGHFKCMNQLDLDTVTRDLKS